jgi:hypothetical protein
LTEVKDIYFNTYSEAVQFALKDAEKKGFTYDEDEYMTIVATGTKKPSEGKTTSFKLPLLKAGKPVKKMLIVNVYNTGKKFELNHYIS